MCHRRQQRLPRHSLEMAHLLANYIRPTRRRPSRQANLLTCRPDSADESRLESPVLVQTLKTSHNTVDTECCLTDPKLRISRYRQRTHHADDRRPDRLLCYVVVQYYTRLWTLHTSEVSTHSILIEVLDAGMLLWVCKYHYIRSVGTWLSWLFLV
jgi:hypothetical protein